MEDKNIMEEKLKILYRYLMLSFQAERKGWHSEYKTIVKDTKEVRERIEKEPNASINEDKFYAGTSFKNWDGFVDKYFKSTTGNGISSTRPRSLKESVIDNIRTNKDTQEIIKSLLLAPTSDDEPTFYDRYIAFKNKIEDLSGDNEKVFCNRFAAGCNIGLSTTVNEEKFATVFDWFVKNGYVDQYNGKNGDWFHKNEYLIGKLNSKLNTEEFRAELKDIEIDKCWVSIFVWLAYKNIANPFSLKKQIVKYGAPGTGKTYSADKLCRLQFDLWKGIYSQDSDLTIDTAFEFVQFHPTYSYEDFIEGLRPIPKEDGSTRLELSNGIFKNLCKKAGKWEVDLYNLGLKPEPNRKFEDFKLKDFKTKKNEKPEVALEADWGFTEDLEDDLKIYEILPPFFIVIDEINRAELSAVFGELMYALEYRGAKYAIKTQYAELNDKDTGILEVDGGYKFFVPHNVYVIGTMNTIDRSVDTFDFALRRRFKWEEVHPDYDLLRMHLSDEKYNVDWRKIVNNLKDLNDAVEKESLLGKDYRIGHAYFMNLKYPKDLSLTQLREQIWEDSLESLFEEYLRGAERPDLLDKFKKEFGLS